MRRRPKRLQDRLRDHPIHYADLRKRHPELRQIEEEFSRLGIEPLLLESVFAMARAGRRSFEEDLAAPTERPKLFLRPSQRVQSLEEALQKAEGLIKFLETERDSDGSLVFPSWKRLKQDIGQHLADLKQAQPAVSRVPRHRPGDPWLTPCVLALARHLRACKVSGAPATRMICRVLVLTGHKDVVTEEKVRHILRKERRRHPDLGVTPDTMKQLPFLLKNQRRRIPDPAFFRGRAQSRTFRSSPNAPVGV
jgi:hypothetical protein